MILCKNLWNIIGYYKSCILRERYVSSGTSINIFNNSLIIIILYIFKYNKIFVVEYFDRIWKLKADEETKVIRSKIGDGDPAALIET